MGRRPLGRHGKSAPDAGWFRLPGSSHRLPCAAARSEVLSHASSQVSSSDNCPKSESRCAGSSRSLGQRCLILRYVKRTSEHSCAVTPGSSAVSACSTLSNAPFTSSIANSYGVRVSSRKCSSLYHAAPPAQAGISSMSSGCRTSLSDNVPCSRRSRGFGGSAPLGLVPTAQNLKVTPSCAPCVTTSYLNWLRPLPSS
jgi:hypothetical protein